MIRGLIRFVVAIVLIVGLGAFFLGYRWADGDIEVVDRPIGTTGIDTSRAREAGAEVGETVAVGADKAQRAVADASLTSKIKAKMALDDTVKAAYIDVDTSGSIVTLSGRVDTEAERKRAMALARETDGVTSVVDRLTVSAR
jgi:hyperosmotically inducible protein